MRNRREDLHSALVESLAERNKALGQLRRKYLKVETELKALLERSGTDEQERDEATKTGEAMVKVIKKAAASESRSG